MEIVAALALLIVPIISVFALAIGLLNAKSLKNLKALVMAMAKDTRRIDENDPLFKYKISEM